MLDRLVIHDVVLIEKLTLEFTAGLNVFTGETGAGKSIVLDALGLALGGRSDVHLIRPGASQASVTAVFSIAENHPVFSLFENQGLVCTSPVILRRLIGKDGKSRAFINDDPVSIALLKSVGEQLLEIHGQFETHGLLNPATHRTFLDSYASLHNERQKTETYFAQWKEADNTRSEILAARDRAQVEEDYLRAALDELNRAAPQTGEADQLAEQRTHLQHREKIMEALHAAEQSLNSDRGAIHHLAQAGRAIARIIDKSADFQSLLTLIDQAAQEATEAVHLLQKFVHTLEDNPNTLQTIEERLFLLRALARKHNATVNDLSDLQHDFEERLALISNQHTTLEELTKKANTARYTYEKQAQDLHQKRQKAALKLTKAILNELPPLKLEQAQLTIEVEALPEDHWSAGGLDRVTFRASTNKGTPQESLHKMASGGELSRFMLALKVVLATSSPIPTLVFDEVDSGIGGATASAVGERLLRLAQHVQILVVTHSPQVAARGHSHWRVHKQTKDEKTYTHVETLDLDARREEIARMLAGAKVTDAARQAALSLLNDDPITPPASKRIRA